MAYSIKGRPPARRAPCLQGLFNFKPSVRPVPLECHIQVSAAPACRPALGTPSCAFLPGWPEYVVVGMEDRPSGALILTCSSCQCTCNPPHAPLQGYPGKFYCPRMATMNKPAYAAIQTHSPIKPVSGGCGLYPADRCSARPALRAFHVAFRPPFWVNSLLNKRSHASKPMDPFPPSRSSSLCRPAARRG